MENSEDMNAKVKVYYEQLNQVQDLLDADPTNTQFISLQKDLLQVISLTEELIKQQKQQENQQKSQQYVVSSDLSANIATSIEPNPPIEHSQSPIKHSGWTTQPQDGETIEENDELEDTSPLKIGDHIEVSGGARLFAGVIMDILNEDEMKIRYYEYETEVILSKKLIKRIRIQNQSLQAKDITLGTKCLCKFASDGQYYEAQITGLNQYGYGVTYVEYGNTEEVPIEYLKPLPTSNNIIPTTTSSMNNNTMNNKHHTTNTMKKENGNKDPSINDEKKFKMIPIPDNLKVLPTDTEDEKQRKLKKLKAIKNKNRIIQQEEQVESVKNTWQSFVNKGVKRSMAGFTKSSSIFSSNDTDSSKVGVLNSGKGMTSYSERKKHKFDETIDE